MKLAFSLILALIFSPLWLIGFLGDLSLRMLQAGWGGGKAFRKWMLEDKA